MQLVKTERDNLLRPLQTVSGIVERRHTLPILANLLITKTGADVSFLSTDLELQITTRADFGTKTILPFSALASSTSPIATPTCSRTRCGMTT